MDDSGARSAGPSATIQPAFIPAWLKRLCHMDLLSPIRCERMRRGVLAGRFDPADLRAFEAAMRIYEGWDVPIATGTGWTPGRYTGSA